MRYAQYFFLIVLILATFSVAATTKDGGFPFLHNVNLMFHEAGHMILLPFGEFVHFLGGTIGQLAIPIIAGLAFLRQGSMFSASVMLWWFGENFADISVYAADARAQAIPLIGGEHDWTYILGKLGLLQYDTMIGNGFWMLGVMLMTGAILLGFYSIKKYSPIG